VCALYRAAPALAERGERVVSTDELTGVQALERKHPGLPPAPGRVERREFEYIRHGTVTFILNRDVATGQVVAPSVGPTRTEEDFVAHLKATLATDPVASRWHFVVRRFTRRSIPVQDGKGSEGSPWVNDLPGGESQREQEHVA